MGSSTKPVNPVLIVTMLPVERAAVVGHLQGCCEVRVKGNASIYERGTFLSLDVIVAQVDPGNASAALETERAIAEFRPRIALLIGVAGGVKDGEIGDVVCGTKVYGYERGADRETEFQPRVDVGLSSYPLLQEAISVAKDTKWRFRIAHTAKAVLDGPKILIGPIAAGEKVVKSSKGAVAQLLKRSFSDALAVEMEASGFLRATYANSVDAIVIRGISALLNKKELADEAASQAMSANHTAACALELRAR